MRATFAQVSDGACFRGRPSAACPGPRACSPHGAETPFSSGNRDRFRDAAQSCRATMRPPAGETVGALIRAQRSTRPRGDLLRRHRGDHEHGDRGLQKVAHADLTMLARLSQALSRARAVPLAA